MKRGRLPLLAALLTLTAAFALAASNAFAYGSDLNIPLNNDTAQEGADCPTDGKAYWHFVISPNNNESYFITFHLNLGDATTYDTTMFVPNSGLDNVFVAVPATKTLTSLIKTGSSADVHWSGEENGPDKFQLSHVCSAAAADLTVTKDAAPSYKRTFKWTIDKSADKATVYSAVGGESDAVTYKVAVTKDGGTDSDWAVSGTINVTNPNNVAVNGVSLSDSTPGGTCDVTPSSVNVAANGSAGAAYTCTFASNPGSGTNTVTATWPEIGSPNTSDDGTAGYTFFNPTTVVNDAIDVTDTNGQSWHFTASGSESYSKSFTDPSGTCTSHENTASIDQTGQSDSVTVQDCQGADLTVSKTAAPSYDLTYVWDLDKSADTDKVYSAGGGESGPVNYTVKVSHDSGTAQGPGGHVHRAREHRVLRHGRHRGGGLGQDDRQGLPGRKPDGEQDGDPVLRREVQVVDRQERRRCVVEDRRCGPISHVQLLGQGLA